jgi:hypothetical protein
MANQQAQPPPADLQKEGEYESPFFLSTTLRVLLSLGSSLHLFLGRCEAARADEGRAVCGQNKQPSPALAAKRLPVNFPRLMGLCLVREKHMDNSQRDIDPDIFEYFSKLPPDILEKMANERLRAQEGQIYREVLLPPRGSASKAILQVKMTSTVLWRALQILKI